MKKYKGVYIDNTFIKSESDADALLKDLTLRKYKALCELFVNNHSIELVSMMIPYEDKLHNEYGLSYEEIEKIQLDAYN